MPPKNKITQFHCLTDGLSIPNEQGKSYVTYRGQTFTITEKMISASLDRNGNSFLDLISSPELQLARWGELKLAVGPCPFEVKPTLPALYRREPHSKDPAPYVIETVTVDYPNVGVRR